MDIEIIKTLASLPTEIVLIYLVIRMQGEKEKLLAAIIESEREHARNLVSIALGCGPTTDRDSRPSGSL